MTNIERARNWLRHGPVGSRFCYHEGHLAYDRDPFLATVLGDTGRARYNNRTNEMAGFMWREYAKGRIMLLQERADNGDFRYWAIKRRT